MSCNYGLQVDNAFCRAAGPLHVYTQLCSLDSVVCPASQHRYCFNSFKDRADWLINLDVDEFYFSRTYPTFQSLVRAAERGKFDAMGLPWYMFGASGYRLRPSKPFNLSIATYHRRSRHCVHDSVNTTYFGRKNGKFLVRSPCFRTLPSPHEMSLHRGCRIFAPKVCVTRLTPNESLTLTTEEGVRVWP